MGSVVSFVPRPLYPWRKSPRYQLNRRLGGPQSRSRRFGEVHSFFSLPGIELRYLGRPARNLVSIPIELCIREIPGSNLDPVIGYPGVVRDFTLSLQANARIVRRS